MAERVAPDQGRFQAFLRRQVVNTYRGGSSELLRKVSHVFLTLAFLPLVLLARALSPLITIRFGGLNSYRIGHFAINTELYLSERDLAKNKMPVLDVLFLDGYVSNRQLSKMWSRVMPISRFARYAHVGNRLLPGSGKHVVPLRASWDVTGILEETPVHLSFTPEEEEHGRRELEKLGLPNGAPFVCLHARDSGYLEYALPSEDPARWRYHDHRDTDIRTCVPAAQHLASNGYFVFRTGVAVKEPLNGGDPKIIDYAVDGRTDFLDIYLGAKCRFFICDTSGISSIPLIFRRPIAWLNYMPLELAPSSGSNDIFLPKMLWSADDRRFLTFGEVLSSDIGIFDTDEQFAGSGINVIDNTSEEISELVLEIEQRLDGTWQTTEEDEELQARFWALFPPRYPNRVFRSRIGAEFLRQHRALLD